MKYTKTPAGSVIHSGWTINVTIVCPHCEADLLGENVKSHSMPTPGEHYLHTESGHQLTYDGLTLTEIHCLDTLDGQIVV